MRCGTGVAEGKSSGSLYPFDMGSRDIYVFVYDDEVAYSRRKVSVCVLGHIQGSRPRFILPPLDDSDATTTKITIFRVFFRPG